MAARHIKRFIQIYRTFAKHRCYFFLDNTSYSAPAKAFGALLAPTQSKNSIIMNNGQKLTLVFQELGPAFIKLGQALSVRPDIIGDDIANELSKLQDRLPPFPGSLAKQIIEKELSKKTSEIFKTFDDQAAAAASIAQVHFAKDMNGNEVAVKILRPNIENRFFKDINLLYWLAKFVNRKLPKYRRLKLSQMVATVANVSKIEMDLLYEAAAADELANNFKDDEDIRVPKIYWQNTTSRVLVLERFNGTPIDEIKKLQDAGHNLDDILKKSADIFLKQTLRDGFFHADMHPGNVMVDKDGKICVYDFGIMGRIDRKTRIFLAELLLGFLNKDYKKVSDIHFEYGIIPEDQSRDLFAQACRSIGEPIFDLPQNQISIAKLLQKLFRVAEQFKMEPQPQLLLLQKTMMMAEGIGRRLNPNLNFWEISRDLIEQWGKENLGPKARIEETYHSALQTIKDFGKVVSNLSRVVTPSGVILHPQVVEKLAKSDNEESFWKGFITAIILTILAFLMITNFR